MPMTGVTSGVATCKDKTKSKPLLGKKSGSYQKEKVRILSKGHDLIKVRILSKGHDLIKVKILSKGHDLIKVRILSKSQHLIKS